MLSLNFDNRFEDLPPMTDTPVYSLIELYEDKHLAVYIQRTQTRLIISCSPHLRKRYRFLCTLQRKVLHCSIHRLG